MPDRVAMKYTAEAHHTAEEAWARHVRRCRTCAACTCEPPNPAELCGDGAELRETIAARRAAWDQAVASPIGWRY